MKRRAGRRPSWPASGGNATPRVCSPGLERIRDAGQQAGFGPWPDGGCARLSQRSPTGWVRPCRSTGSATCTPPEFVASLARAVRDRGGQVVEGVDVIDARDERGGVAVLTRTGERQLHDAVVLARHWRSSCTRGPTSPASGSSSSTCAVSRLAAAGVTVLAQAHRRCRTRDARLVIRTGRRNDVLRLLQLNGLADLVAVDPAEVEPLTKGARTAPRPRPRPRRSSTRRPSAGVPRRTGNAPPL